MNLVWIPSPRGVKSFDCSSDYHNQVHDNVRKRELFLRQTPIHSLFVHIRGVTKMYTQFKLL